MSAYAVCTTSPTDDAYTMLRRNLRCRGPRYRPATCAICLPCLLPMASVVDTTASSSRCRQLHWYGYELALRKRRRTCRFAPTTTFLEGTSIHRFVQHKFGVPSPERVRQTNGQLTLSLTILQYIVHVDCGFQPARPNPTAMHLYTSFHDASATRVDIQRWPQQLGPRFDFGSPRTDSSVCPNYRYLQ